jgi:hypothetical protein
MLKPMTVSQQFELSFVATDDKNRPADVEGGSVTWGSSDESVARVIGDPITGKALVVAQGPGTYKITATADADLGPDAVFIFGEETGTVTAGGQAVKLGLSQGEIVEQPPVVPPEPLPPLSAGRR